MNRREFLVRVGGTVLAVPMVLEAVSCGDDNPVTPQTSFTLDGSNVSGHSHFITIQCTELTHTSAIFTSTIVNGHTHDVMLTQSELQTVGAGGSISKNSSVDSGHFHSWIIQKPSGACM
jgi:hypothetical protein